MRDIINNLVKAPPKSAMVDPAIQTFGDPKDYRGYNFTFTNRWFQCVRPSFQEYLLAKAPFKSVLEVGAFEGASTFWFLLNLCTPTDSRIWTIDYDPQKLFYKNRDLLPKVVSDKLTLVKGLSPQSLHDLPGPFDLAYIDATHYPDDILTELIIISTKMAPGGIILLDDCDDDYFNRSSDPEQAKGYFKGWNEDELQKGLDRKVLPTNKGVLTPADTVRICAAILSKQYAFKVISQKTMMLTRIASKEAHVYKPF